MKYYLISFGTPSYWERLEAIESKAKSIGMRTWIFYFENFPEQKLYKSTFIIDCLKKLNCPVMWLDADSLLLDKPKVGKFDFDFGHVKPSWGGKKPFADSCHFWTPNPGAFDLLKRSRKLCKSGKGRTHSKLIKAFNESSCKGRDVSEWIRGVYVRNYGKRGEIWY